jgi:hypothetical protein
MMKHKNRHHPLNVSLVRGKHRLIHCTWIWSRGCYCTHRHLLNELHLRKALDHLLQQMKKNTKIVNIKKETQARIPNEAT